MKTLLIILAIIIPVTSTAGNLWTPGSQFNPYIVKQTGPGQQELTTQYPDPSRPLMAPGQPYNPYVIRNTPDGTTMQTEWPLFDNDESGGDD